MVLKSCMSSNEHVCASCDRSAFAQRTFFAPFEGFQVFPELAGSKGLNRKTVSFLMTDPDAHRCLVRELKQPVPPVQPRAERGFIRSHFPHLRLSSHGEKEQRKDSSSSQVGSPDSESFNLSHQNSSTCASADDDSSHGDSLSSVLLANAQPLSHRLGSLDRPAALQKTSLKMSSRYASRGLLDNGSGISDFGPPGDPHYYVQPITCS